MFTINIELLSSVHKHVSQICVLLHCATKSTQQQQKEKDKTTVKSTGILFDHDAEGL